MQKTVFGEAGTACLIWLSCKAGKSLLYSAIRGIPLEEVNLGYISVQHLVAKQSKQCLTEKVCLDFLSLDPVAEAVELVKRYCYIGVGLQAQRTG